MRRQQERRSLARSIVSPRQTNFVDSKLKSTARVQLEAMKSLYGSKPGFGFASSLSTIAILAQQRRWSLAMRRATPIVVVTSFDREHCRLRSKHRVWHQRALDGLRSNLAAVAQRSVARDGRCHREATSGPCAEPSRRGVQECVAQRRVAAAFSLAPLHRHNKKRRCCQRRSGAPNVEPAHFDWHWRERPALALLAWEATIRGPPDKLRHIRMESMFQ